MGRRAFGLAGAMLSLGSPLGWLVIRWSQGVGPLEEIQNHPFLIAYLFFATMGVFALAGYFIGAQWEKLCEANQVLAELSWRDGLTGLPNTRRFWEDVEKECLRTIRHGTALHLLAIDLDHFKAVNDTYGHLVGDEVLKAAAQAMTKVMRKDEGIYRVGGEEFGAILVDTTMEQAEKVAERLRKAIEALRIPVHHEGRSEELEVTASLGVAGWKCSEPRDFQKLYQHADEALYEAKRAGRNCVVAAGSMKKSLEEAVTA